MQYIMPPPIACHSPAPLISRASRYLLPAFLQFKRREASSPRNTSSVMGKVSLPSHGRKQATSRLCNISSFPTELLELHSNEPSLQIIFIPGNPGIVSFYKDFVQAMYELLEGKASITAIGHISHTRTNWEHGRTFSLQDQINHKVYFIEQELQYTEVPIILVGHSIGSYICLEIFKRFPQQVKLTVGLYPFLTLDTNSLKQSMISMTAGSPLLCAAISSLIALLGLFPTWIKSALVRTSIGPSWSATAVEAACTHLLRYHTMRNVLFMAATEFKKLSEEFDWAFMRRNRSQIALLFGVDDHWAPLSFFEEVSRQVPDIALSVEREGHSHAFCCTKSGSSWVSHHVVGLIKNRFPN